MGFWGLLEGTLRDYHRDPSPHSLLRTRKFRVWGFKRLGGPPPELTLYLVMVLVL